MERCTRTSASNYFDRRSNEAQKQRLIKRLAELGYAAELTPITA
jgi:hypothetical protein